MFGDPFSNKLNALVGPKVEKILKDAEGGVQLHTGKTVVCMEGAYFWTTLSRSINKVDDRPCLFHEGGVIDVSSMGRGYHQYVCHSRSEVGTRSRARVREP